MSAPLIAICVGHSRQIKGKTEGGAVSVGGVSEHSYNYDLAQIIRSELSKMVIASFIVSEYKGAGYTAAQKWLSGYIKGLGATLALELHFNSAAPSAEGHEWLHWATSKNGQKLATAISVEFSEEFPDRKKRGVKPIGSADRGGEFLKLTHCPAVICEPFFGSNQNEWRFAEANQSKIGLVIAKGIRDYLSA